MNERSGRDSAYWPKQTPTLTPDQERIREDFVDYWLSVLPRRYGLIEWINHRLAVPPLSPRGGRTLEVGAGRGAHLAFEDLADQDYTALELRPALAVELQSRFPAVRVPCGDVQQRIDAPDASFDRVLAIHVLEHLPDVPAALREIRRVLRPDGVFGAVIPCEGGQAYTLARRISAQRLFEQRYGCSYDWFVRSEHINTVWPLLDVLRASFPRTSVSYWPFRVPSIHLNLVLGVECRLM